MTSRNSGENTDGRNPDGTFADGNPGKRMGVRNRATRAVQDLLDAQTEALTSGSGQQGPGGRHSGPQAVSGADMS